MIPAYLYYRYQQKKARQQGENGTLQMSSITRSFIERIVYNQKGVVAKLGDESDADDAGIQGILTIVERQDGVYIEWCPLPDEPKEDTSWVVTGGDDLLTANGNGQAHSPEPTGQLSEMQKRLRFSIDIKDLRSFQEVIPKRGKPRFTWLRFCTKDGASYVPLHFHQGDHSKFIEKLQGYVVLKRSAKESTLILVTDERVEALEQSVSMLDLHSDFLSRMVANPYATALTGLGKVATFVQGQVIPSFLDMDAVDQEDHIRAMRELTENVQQSENEAGELRLHDDAGFELVTKLDLPERPLFSRETPMTEDQWNKFRTSDGVFHNIGELKQLVFRGGLSPSLRSEGWKYLLGYFDWKKTTADNIQLRKRRMDDYYRMKLQWKTITEEQERHFGDFRDRKALVDKDVARTDRSHQFFLGDNNSNVSLLNDILMTYCMYNFDLGYVQGMSDFLSPILLVQQNEVDAFWCFVGLMERVHGNFEMNQMKIKNQLAQLRDLLMVVNPKLVNYLESHSSDDMYFCFRWVLVIFKREFSIEAITRLWEVLWTDRPCANFHLLICVAILDRQMHYIIENKFGLTEILKHVNDLSMHIDLEETLTSAEAIYHQLAATQDKLPRHVCQILNLGDSSYHPE